MFNAFLRFLAVDRIVRLITEDAITEPARDWVDREWPESKIPYLVHCRACVSVWAALIVISGILPRRIQYALAASAAVLMMDRQDDRIGALVSAYGKQAARGVIQG